MLFVLCVALWLLAVGLFFTFCPLQCLLLVTPVKHCDHLVGGEGAGCFASLWFVACVISIMVCLLFFLVSLVGYSVVVALLGQF